MASPSDAAPGRREIARVAMTLRRKLVFTAMTVCLLWALAELAAVAACSVMNGSLMTPDRIAESRDREVTPQAESPGVDSNRTHPHLRVTALHPYIGYVARSDLPLSTQPDVVLSDETREAAHISEQGFPTVDGPTLQKRGPGRLIVGVTGGSLARNLAIGATEVLRRKLAERSGVPNEVVVLGIANGGCKQPQQLITLSYLLSLGGEFDVIVNLDGFNEVALHLHENAPKGVYPAYPRSWFFTAGGLHSPEFIKLAGRLQIVEEQRRNLARRHSGFPWRYSMIASLWWSAAAERLTKQHAELTRQLQSAETDSDDYATTGPACDLSSTEEAFEFLTDIWMRSSLQMHHVCQGHGIHYIHCLQPNQYDPGSKVLTEWENENTWLENHPYRNGVEPGYPLLRQKGQLLKSRGVNFVDLTALYSQNAETIYHDTCCHVNEHGNALLASAIADLICDRLTTRLAARTGSLPE